MRVTEALRKEFYFFAGVTHPQHEDDPLKPKRKILADLWLQLIEDGVVKPYVGAMNNFASAFEKRDTGVSIALEETLDKTIDALRRKAKARPRFNRGKR